jgi:hypothetical protein
LKNPNISELFFRILELNKSQIACQGENRLTSKFWVISQNDRAGWEKLDRGIGDKSALTKTEERSIENDKKRH